MGIVIDIRGTHGSGKSYIPHFLINMYHHQEWFGEPITYEGRMQILGYYIPTLNLQILGRYETACGGCDGIKTQEEIKNRVLESLEEGCNVLLEGILVAHTFGPWSEFAKGRDWHFCFLDTPLQSCIERVNLRRAASGKEALPDPRNIIRDWHRIRGLEPKFREAGHTTHWLDYRRPVQDVMEIIHAKAQL